MEKFSSNSDKSRENSAERAKKKIESVVDDPARVRKKGELQKFADAFMVEDANSVLAHLMTEVVIPAAKKVISDIVVTGIDMVLYGESGDRRRNNGAQRVSYRDYYERPSDRIRSGSYTSQRTELDYDDIVFDTRGDAESVLEAMRDIIYQYGTVSVAELYDLARVPNDNFTMNRYGWVNLSGAQTIRVRDGYTLKLPKVVPLN